MHRSPVGGDNDGGNQEPALCLQVVSGESLLCVNLANFQQMVEEDGNFSVEQLTRLSEYCRCVDDVSLITQVKDRFPFIINVQDSGSGDTVLHSFTSAAGNLLALEAWLASGSVVAAGAAGYNLLNQQCCRVYGSTPCNRWQRARHCRLPSIFSRLVSTHDSARRRPSDSRDCAVGGGLAAAIGQLHRYVGNWWSRWIQRLCSAAACALAQPPVRWLRST